MPHEVLSPDALERALSVRDLTDPAQGRHAVQQMLERIVKALRDAWGCPAIVERGSRIVSVADNYDRLRYPPDGAAREARYTRYVSAGHLLRTQTTAAIPPLLARLAAAPPEDALLVCPGVVYRRDAIDRLHAAEPHQVDLWRLRRGGDPLAVRELAEMIASVARAAAPGLTVSVTPSAHPYTLEGRQIDVRVRGEWIEVGECGLAHPSLLADAGLPGTTGLAMGLGLDRLAMLAKGLDDIRLLRSEDPRIASQMLDLSPWRPVSRHPPVRRDLSVAVAASASAEELGDRVREALGPESADVEAIDVVSETPAAALPETAQARLGIRTGQKNVLLRLTLRALDRNLTDAEANRLRDEVYAAVHAGDAREWAARAG